MPILKHYLGLVAEVSLPNQQYSLLGTPVQAQLLHELVSTSSHWSDVRVNCTIQTLLGFLDNLCKTLKSFHYKITLAGVEISLCTDRGSI